MAIFSSLSFLSSIFAHRKWFPMNFHVCRLYHSFVFWQNTQPWNVTCPLLSFTLHVKLAIKVSICRFPESHFHHSGPSLQPLWDADHKHRYHSSGPPPPLPQCSAPFRVQFLNLPSPSSLLMDLFFMPLSPDSSSMIVTSHNWHLAPDFISPMFVMLLWFKYCFVTVSVLVTSSNCSIVYTKSRFFGV